MLTTEERKAKIWAVVRVTCGNFLEMYDFMVFGYYAAAIGKAFFPSGNEFASLMLSLMTFWVGFLMRPLGGLILGAYTDHHGRRKGLMVTLGLMAVGIVSIGLCPGYDTIGIAAPLIVVAGRLLQGFSAGAEVGAVSVYLSEIATPGRKGFYVCWQSCSQNVSVIFAASLGLFLNGVLTPAKMQAWGWRIPLLIGTIIIPFLFRLRRSLQESDEFKARKAHPSLSQILHSLVSNWAAVIVGLMLSTMTTVSFYFLSAYTPTFGHTLKLQAIFTFTVTLCVAVSNIFWLPVSGALSDRFGRKPVLIGSASLMLLTAYLSLSWLAAAPSFQRLLAVELWLSFVYASFQGTATVFITEILPVEVRTTGFGLCYSLATALFGGITPAICTYLIHVTNNRAIPSVWLCSAAACGLIAAVVAKPYVAPTQERAVDREHPAAKV